MPNAAIYRLRIVAFLMLLLPVAAFTVMLTPPDNTHLWTAVMTVLRQDIWLLSAQFLILCVVVLPIAAPSGFPQFSVRQVQLIALIVVLACYAGHTFILSSHDLIRDEQMASFDTYIFAHGRLVWPLPEQWRPDAAVLNLGFTLPVDHPVAWVSSYFPGNAALRAVVAQVADPGLTGPLLTGTSLVVLWSCARKIWPADDNGVSTVCVLLLGSSGQFLFTGMSTFAMPGHLLLNLVWLRLYLVDRRGTDIAALLVGALATGLHQPLFHPMFVFPFLIFLLSERRWARLGLLAAGYLAIGLFWLSWPLLMMPLVTGPGSIVASSGADYFSRLTEALAGNSDNLAVMAGNLLRFVTWQHVLALPLALLAIIGLRGNPLGQALALGIGLTIVIMTVILPWQGNGFGYRYLHGLLGNLILLAGFGWCWLASQLGAVRPALIRATVASLIVILPLQVWMTHDAYDVFARSSQKIDNSGADYMIIDIKGGVGGAALVYNRPDLSNRPIRLLSDKIENPGRLARMICANGATLAFASNAFYRPVTQVFGIAPRDTAEARLVGLKKPYERAGCRIKVID